MMFTVLIFYILFTRLLTEQIVAMTNWDYYEAVQRFQRILEAEKISDALKAAGALEGDLVMIGELLNAMLCYG